MCADIFMCCLSRSTGGSGSRKSRRQPLDNSDDDSDEQTLSDEEENDSDSEEDLDSPRRVYQARAVDIPSTATAAEGDSPPAAAAAAAAPVAAESEASSTEKMEVDQTAAPEGNCLFIRFCCMTVISKIFLVNVNEEVTLMEPDGEVVKHKSIFTLIILLLNRCISRMNVIQGQ